MYKVDDSHGDFEPDDIFQVETIGDEYMVASGESDGISKFKVLHLRLTSF